MNAIVGYMSMVAVIVVAVLVLLTLIPIVNDGACASIELHQPVGKTLMQILFVCWW